MRTLKCRSYDTIEQAYCPFITDHLKRDLYPHIDVQQWTGRDRAKKCGAIGGRKSRRTKVQKQF